MLNLRYVKPKNYKTQKIFLRWYNFIDKSQWWSKERLQEYQWKKLKDLITHAYAHVPYYQEVFRDIGAVPEDIKSYSDFKKIPYLTKDLIRERINELFPENYSKQKSHFYTTGGSTGEPLGFYKKKENDIIERAFMHNQWSRVGYCKSSSRVILRGEPIVNNELFQKKRFSKDWLFSSYHLSERYIKEYINKLNEIKPEFFHVYPTSFYVFTQLLLESNYLLNFSPKAILCGSENLYDYQRELFEKTYKTRAYSWLGLAEQTTLAGECEHSNYLHAWPQHSYVELLDKGINLDGVGEIVGTNLHNYVTPFIRYKSGDLAVNGGDNCRYCGRNFPVFKKILGREQYTIRLKDNKLIPLTAITFGLHFNAFSRIKAMQIIQEKVGEIIIRIEALSSFSKADEIEIRSKMKKAVSDELSIFFRYDGEILRTHTGKNKFFINRL